jgi:hypothetical protein
MDGNNSLMPIFILGAGFNADATVEAGLFADSLSGRYRIDCSYPLVGDTMRLCFGLDRLPAGKSVEDLFAEARDDGPLKLLAKRLQYADSRIARHLASDECQNSYRRFFAAFPASNFLTFNYDSLPETFLFRLGSWYPRDGYGMAVSVTLPPGEEDFTGRRSSAQVLHLHGSLCIRTSECEARREPGQAMAMVMERDKPLYAFAPASISDNFAPFLHDAREDDVEDRIIAPVPDKSTGLRQPFVRDTYTKAKAMVRASDTIVTIGYSFNPHDRASYEPLLRALSESTGRKLLVVSPDAAIIADALRAAFPNAFSIEPLKVTFKKWVADQFPGL